MVNQSRAAQGDSRDQQFMHQQLSGYQPQPQSLHQQPQQQQQQDVADFYKILNQMRAAKEKK